MGTKYQPVSVRNRLKKTIDDLKVQIDPDSNPLAHREVRNWDEQKDKLKGLESKLESITPPPVESGEERAKLEKRRDDLIHCIRTGSSSLNVPSMPSDGEMKNNPDYSTDGHRRHEETWKRNTIVEEGNDFKLELAKNGYGAMFELKDLWYRLGQEEENLSANLGSLEQIRPGHMAPLADDHAPRTFGPPRISQKEYDRQNPSHEPLPSEVQAGIYHTECVVCGRKTTNKHSEYCAIHQSIGSLENRSVPVETVQ